MKMVLNCNFNEYIFFPELFWLTYLIHVQELTKEYRISNKKNTGEDTAYFLILHIHRVFCFNN